MGASAEAAIIATQVSSSAAASKLLEPPISSAAKFRMMLPETSEIFGKIIPNDRAATQLFGSQSYHHRRGAQRVQTKRLWAGDYDSIDDLLRAPSNELNSGGRLLTGPAGFKSRLMLERHPRQVPNNPQLEEQLDELINHTMDSLNCMEPTELTTVILFMAKIVNTLKEAKQRRKMNRNHHAFGKLLLDKDSGPMEDVFDFLAIAADRILPAYSARHISNLAYAYALIGYNPKLDNQTLLQNIGNESIGFIEGFNAFANIAWAYAVANVDAPTIFNGTFTDALLKRVHAFTVDGRHQLYQWHIWQTKELSHAGLPEDAREQCYQTFATVDATVSRLQKDVVQELRSMDLKPVEEYVTPSGYSIDAFVEVDDRRVGIEVDGPSHFVD
ncbi:hypothetical protein ACHAWO_007972 [Cyclotella atomus]|uniref:Uncharacterized protein n=1 Tax=Cyclotella atomus TaxID=382360 RepID=A0ABD3MZK8_9STRA